jgi:DsbC/DsbD-like thiol-disulfide interchange protein
MPHLRWPLWLPVLVALNATVARAQEKPITWTLKVNTGAHALKPGDTFNVQATAQIKDGWHVYATNEPRGGPRPTSFALPSDQPFKLNGIVSAPPPHTSFDANFDQPTKFYEQTVTFTLPVLVATDASAGRHQLQVVVAYQSCSQQLCLPVKKVLLVALIEIAPPQVKSNRRKPR